MNERIAYLADYVKKNDIYPQPVDIEFDDFDENYPEAMRNAKRAREYLLAQPVRIDDRTELVGLMRFIGKGFPGNIFQRNGFTHFRKLAGQFYGKPVDNLITFEWQHTNANFDRVIANGLESYMADIQRSLAVHAAEPEKQVFLSALLIWCSAIIDWADKCADACLEKAAEAPDEARRAMLENMARILRRVPRLGAETFDEAVQSLYLCFQFLPDSIGLPDRYLLPYYRKGIADGTLTREHAKERLQELFVMINGFTVFSNSWASDKGGESHFVVGGYRADGEDNFNELSELILEAMMDAPLYRPQVTLRWTKKLPRAVFAKVLEMERNDFYKRIAFVNDEAKIPALMENGHFTFAQACEYLMVGCNESTFAGSLNFGGNNGNIVRSLERTLFDHTAEVLSCPDFNAFYAVYERELNRDLRELCNWMDLFNAVRAKDIDVVSSLFMDGCIERGVSATQGGCKRNEVGSSLIGYVCLLDSLAIIDQFVYEEKRVPFGEFIEILRNNWAGAETLRAEILKRGRFHGNGYARTAEIAKMLSESLHQFTSGKHSLFGQRMAFGTLTGYNPHYVWFGEKTAATPDGRFAGEPLNFGIGQTGIREREGMTGLLSSVASIDPAGAITGSSVCNLTVDKSTVDTPDKFDKFVSLLETYFKLGGLHFQNNYLSPEELHEAKAHPDDYADLRVRVSGFSAYFTRLNPGLQDDVIRRAVEKA